MLRLARALGAAGFVLPAIDFFDELASGLPSAGAPELRGALSVGVAVLSFVVFTAPQLLSIAVETPLLLWAERRPRSRMIALGLAGMGVSLLVAGTTSSAALFAAAFALYAPASGLACGLAQAALMDSDPAQRERRMAAWAFSGWLGDLATPLLIGGVLALSLDFRVAWWIAGVSLLCAALWVSRLPLTQAQVSDGEPAASLSAALGNRRMLAWLFAVALCSLMDETLVALTALWMKERFPDQPQALTFALVAFGVGGAGGLALLDRLLRRCSARRLLALASAGSLGLYAAWLSTESIWCGSALMFLVGAFSAAQYPVAQAQAYRAAGDRSGLVAAAGSVFSIFDLAFPIALGVLADRAGVSSALAALLLQPLGLLVILSLTARRPRRPEP